MNPPKVPLAFRVGVVGHRPNRLAPANIGVLSSLMTTILHTVKEEVLACFRDEGELYDSTPPQVVALSPLAEGVDRLFADAALQETYQLTAVLPFARNEYEKDFSPTHAAETRSDERFRELLAQARAVFELDGSRADEPYAYKKAGDVVLNQADLLIVVWDGKQLERRGGTEDTFDAAIEHGVPIVWIDAYAPHHWRLVTQPIHRVEEIEPGERAALVQSQNIEDLQRQVRKSIEFPHRPGSPDRSHHHLEASFAVDPLKAIQEYYAERQAKYNWFFLWKFCRNAVGDLKIRMPVLKVKPYEEAVLSNWPRHQDQPIETRIDQLRPFYAWSDKLAECYADRYRSAFVFVFIAAAISVGLALAAIGFGLPEDNGVVEGCFVIGELVAIVLMLQTVRRGRNGQWHRRWLDYRLLAEILRHQHLIVHFGGERATPLVPEHWTGYGDLSSTWMAWYARAIERSIGLPNAVLDQNYLRSCLRHLENELVGPNGQVSFHEETSARSERIEHRLHWCEVKLLQATVISCLLHLLHILMHEYDFLVRQYLGEFGHELSKIPSHPLTFFCGFFPAIGAALAGITNQGEFRRIALRSKSMCERLKGQLKQIKFLEKQLGSQSSEKRQLSTEIMVLAGNIARTMVSEVLDWRVIFQDRPLKAG